MKAHEKGPIEAPYSEYGASTAYRGEAWGALYFSADQVLRPMEEETMCRKNWFGYSIFLSRNCFSAIFFRTEFSDFRFLYSFICWNFASLSEIT